MPRPRKTTAKKASRAELEAERDRLTQPMQPPRLWLKGCQRDPRLAAALLRNIERNILLR
jgi:hypothetical protein